MPSAGKLELNQRLYHLLVSVNIYILFFLWSSIGDIIKMFRIVSEISGESSSCKRYNPRPQQEHWVTIETNQIFNYSVKMTENDF